MMLEPGMLVRALLGEPTMGVIREVLQDGWVKVSWDSARFSPYRTDREMTLIQAGALEIFVDEDEKEKEEEEEREVAL